MTEAPPLLTFRIPKPHEAGLRMVRKALAQSGLQTPLELDIAQRIRRELGPGVAPCVVLYVDDPAVLLETAVFHRGAGLVIPQPVVVSSAGRHTQVFAHSAGSLAGESPASVRDALLGLHSRIARGLESIAEPQEARTLVTP